MSKQLIPRKRVPNIHQSQFFSNNSLLKNFKTENYLVFQPSSLFNNKQQNHRKVKSYSQLLKKTTKRFNSNSKQKQFRKWEEQQKSNSVKPMLESRSNSKNKFILQKNCFNKIVTQACLLRSGKQKSKLAQFLKQSEQKYISEQNTKVIAQPKHIVPRQIIRDTEKIITKQNYCLPKILFKTKKQKNIFKTKNITLSNVVQNSIDIDGWDFQDQYPVQF